MVGCGFTSKKDKSEFLGKPAPAGYVAGVGRGATAFTTRSDIGPARTENDITDERNPQLRNKQREMQHQQKMQEEQNQKNDDDDEMELNEMNYDEFSGYKSNLFAKDPYEKDDEEADNIYAAVDERMDQRRRKRREIIENQRIAKMRKLNPKIQHSFMDVKQELLKVTEAEWLSIPEVGDSRSKKIRNPRPEKFTPIPDSIISGNIQSQTNGLMTPFPADHSKSANSSKQNFSNLKIEDPIVKLSEARKSLVSVKLDQFNSSTGTNSIISKGTATSVDPKGYLTDLSNISGAAAGGINQLNDIKKARQLLKSVIESNQTHGSGWIAAARLEEVTGQVEKARNLITKATKHCPNQQDVWLEAIRLQPNVGLSKSMCSLALQKMPNSVDLWIKAADLEQPDVKAMRKVFRRGLETLPSSTKLWKLAIQLEKESDAIIMLHQAVECCPTCSEFWLTLAEMETFENARTVLNKARLSIPTDRYVWFAAAKLEEKQLQNKQKEDINESEKHQVLIKMLIEKGLMSLKNDYSIEIKRDEWLKDAGEIEISNFPLTACAIVDNVAVLHLEEVDVKRVLLEDAESFIEKKCLFCAEQIYKLLLANPKTRKKSVYLAFAHFYMNCFESDNHINQKLFDLLKEGITNCSQCELLWLVYAKCLWKRSTKEHTSIFDEPRQVLMQGLKYIPNSEEIWLAAIKIENEYYQESIKSNVDITNVINGIRKLSNNARNNAPTPKVYLKCSKLEWNMNEYQGSFDLLNMGIEKFPKYSKFYLVKIEMIKYANSNGIQIKENLIEPVIKLGMANCQADSELYLLDCECEYNKNNHIKARTIYEKGRLSEHFKKDPDMWLESVRFELKTGNKNFAYSLLERAISDLSSGSAGKLWFEKIFAEDRKKRMTMAIQALKRCENDSWVLLAISILFWVEGKVAKARSWFAKAAKSNTDNGDVYIYWHRFEQERGDGNSKVELVNEFKANSPKHGDVWRKLLKRVENWKRDRVELLKEASAALSMSRFF